MSSRVACSTATKSWTRRASWHSRGCQREQLIAQVVGGIQSPIAGLVNVLNGTIRNLAVVLNQVAEQKGSQA